MARESQLWLSLAKARPILREQLHMNRVENSATPGSPDVEGFYVRTGFFQFELKSEDRPARPATPIRFKMRPAQVEYARKRWDCGGAVFWLLQVGEGADRQVYMLEGPHGPALEDGMTEDQLREADLLKNPKFDPVETIEIAFR